MEAEGIEYVLALITRSWYSRLKHTIAFNSRDQGTPHHSGAGAHNNWTLGLVAEAEIKRWVTGGSDVGQWGWQKAIPSSYSGRADGISQPWRDSNFPISFAGSTQARLLGYSCIQSQTSPMLEDIAASLPHLATKSSML